MKHDQRVLTAFDFIGHAPPILHMPTTSDGATSVIMVHALSKGLTAAQATRPNPSIPTTSDGASHALVQYCTCSLMRHFLRPAHPRDFDGQMALNTGKCWRRGVGYTVEQSGGERRQAECGRGRKGGWEGRYSRNRTKLPISI